MTHSAKILRGELGTRKVGDHPVEVRTRTPNDELSVGHIVFVQGHGEKPVRPDFAGPAGNKRLTVGESAGFGAQSGVINLTVEENKVHFEINHLAADRTGLKIGSGPLSIEILKQQDRGKKSSNHRTLDCHLFHSRFLLGGGRVR
jgi:YfiR/HmsC-like